MKGKKKRNELKPEIVAVLHTVKNYNIIEPPLYETRKQDRSDKRIFGIIRYETNYSENNLDYFPKKKLRQMVRKITIKIKNSI